VSSELYILYISGARPSVYGKVTEFTVPGLFRLFSFGIHVMEKIGSLKAN
jgi:hypothetical protein